MVEYRDLNVQMRKRGLNENNNLYPKTNTDSVYLRDKQTLQKYIENQNKVNSYYNAIKEKIDTVEVGAEKNQNAYSKFIFDDIETNATSPTSSYRFISGDNIKFTVTSLGVRVDVNEQTLSTANEHRPGLMTVEMFRKLQNIEDNANKYEHPAVTLSPNQYLRVTTNKYGHVIDGNNDVVTIEEGGTGARTLRDAKLALGITEIDTEILENSPNTISGGAVYLGITKLQNNLNSHSSTKTDSSGNNMHVPNNVNTGDALTKTKLFLKEGNKWSALPNASTTDSGIVQLSDTIAKTDSSGKAVINEEASSYAATVKAVYDILGSVTGDYNSLAKIESILKNHFSTKIDSNKENKENMHVPNNVNSGDELTNTKLFLKEGNVWSALPNASINDSGIVQLSNSITGESDTIAATEKAVKSAVDEAEKTAKKLISDLIGGASESYNTLKEIEKWIGDHEDLYNNLLTALAGKAETDHGIHVPNNVNTGDALTKTKLFLKEGNKWSALPNASTTDSGIVQLSDTIAKTDSSGKAVINEEASSYAATVKAVYNHVKSLSDDIEKSYVKKETGKGLSTNDLTADLKSNYDAAYTHSKASHAPTDAEKNVIVGIKKNGVSLTPDADRSVNITVPTKISDLTNDSGYVTSSQSVNYATSAGNADTVDGHHFNWSGQDGQPTWVWGGNDSTNMYVYNPSNFNVNYANSAGNADTLDGNHASAFATASHTHSSVNNVTPEWAGSIEYSDTSWLAAWTSDGGKIKALNKNSFATASHTHSNYISNFGNNPTCGNGTSITQPGGNSAISIRTTSGTSKDVGILYLSEDNAYIANASDNGYAFAVFDTDLTTDMSSVNDASFVVLSNGAGAKIRGQEVIHSGNIGSQSVNYASSAGNADTVDGHHFNWSGQDGQPTWVWGGNDSTNMYVYNPSNFNVNYASSAGNADTVDGHHFNWSGQDGQPTWIWGGNDSSNMYVYNPSNFSVNYANEAGTVKGSYTFNGGQQNPNYFGVHKVGFLMMNTPVNGDTNYKDWIIMDCHGGNDVGGATAIGVDRQAMRAFIMGSDGDRTSWTRSAELITTANIGSQSVSNADTLDGNHASAFATASHTHNYAGSSSAGGSATSALKLTTNAGSATKPVYFSNGKPVACTDVREWKCLFIQNPYEQTSISSIISGNYVEFIIEVEIYYNGDYVSYLFPIPLNQIKGLSDNVKRFISGYSLGNTSYGCCKIGVSAYNFQLAYIWYSGQKFTNTSARIYYR